MLRHTAQRMLTPRRDARGDGFQFLIGRLQTQLTNLAVACRAWFQFLIGRLQTFNRLMVFGNTATFQFLIGRLQTPILRPYKWLVNREFSGRLWHINRVKPQKRFCIGDSGFSGSSSIPGGFCAIGGRRHKFLTGHKNRTQKKHV